MVVAVGRGQSAAFVGNDESRAVACAGDVKFHHVAKSLAKAARLKIVNEGQAMVPRRGAQPMVQEFALLDRLDHRRVGTCELHWASRIRSRRRTGCGRGRDEKVRGRSWREASASAIFRFRASDS